MKNVKSNFRRFLRSDTFLNFVSEEDFPEKYKKSSMLPVIRDSSVLDDIAQEIVITTEPNFKRKALQLYENGYNSNLQKIEHEISRALKVLIPI